MTPGSAADQRTRGTITQFEVTEGGTLRMPDLAQAGTRAEFYVGIPKQRDL